VAILPSAERLAAIGLAIAGATILALAFLVLSDVARESDLHREVLVVQQQQDSLEALRVRINGLVAAARLGAATGDAEAFRALDRHADEIDERLDGLQAAEEAPPDVESLVNETRLLLVNARSVAGARHKGGAEAGALAVRETERVAAEVGATLERSLEALTRRVSDRSLARIRVDDRLRRYVGWFVGGSVIVLGGLFVAFRRVQQRERAAQQRIEWLAHFDPVTGLPNRALLTDRLSQETARSRRGKERFALVLFDLDGFKEVNDTWGHAAGDRVLAAVAERGRECMRASDTLGRQGGDEFMAILPDTGEEGALAVAEKLRACLCEAYPLDGESAIIGVSLGVSLYPAHGEDAESLLRAADAALYEAKREGKGRVRIARATGAHGRAAGRRAAS